MEPFDSRKGQEGDEAPPRYTAARTSTDEDVITIEDLRVGDPWRFFFNRDRCEWSFEVIGSVGYPRKLLGTLVLTLKDDGSLMLTIE